MTLHPTLGWMLAGVFAALGAGSLARLVSLYGKPQELVRKRVDSLKTWWVITPTFAAAIMLGQFAIAIVFAVAGGLALREYARLVSSRTADHDLQRIALSMIPAHYLLICFDYSTAAMLFLPIGALLVLSISRTAAGQPDRFTHAVPSRYWGLILLVYAPSFAVMLWNIPPEKSASVGPVGWFLYLMILTEMNDIAQAFFGRHWGNRLIAPVVSPFKTWIGFYGGVATTVTLAALLAPFLTSFGGNAVSYTVAMTTGLMSATAAGLLISIIGYFGDINLSAVKRHAGVKDSGTLLPGQGGILDRIDSLTFTALQSGWVKITIPGLRHFEFKLSQSRVDRLRLETVGVRASLLGALIRLGADVLGPFDLHGFVKEDLHRVCHA
ncbi:MAG: phosphatidate cytidylyltransferase, partial [Planctomycetaceae bacterium]